MACYANGLNMIDLFRTVFSTQCYPCMLFFSRAKDKENWWIQSSFLSCSDPYFDFEMGIRFGYDIYLIATPFFFPDKGQNVYCRAPAGRQRKYTFATY